MPAGSVAPIGPVGSAPQVPIQSPLAGALQAVGDYPATKQKYDYQQAEIDAQGIDNSSKKLAVLTKVMSASPAMYTNPQMIDATTRAFAGLGLPAPMKVVNGVKQLDPEAMAAFGPAADFMASNLSTVLSFPPEQRAALVQTFTGQQLSPEFASRLASLPQRMISTPSELANIYGKATSLVESLRYPGTDVNSVIAALKPMNELLTSNGMPSIDLEQIGQSAYTNLLQQATLNGLQGKAAEEWANAGYAKIRTELYPTVVAAQTTNAQAHQTEAGASMIRAKSYAARALPEINKDNATTQHLKAETADLLGQTGTGSTKSNEQHLTRLGQIATEAEGLYARYTTDYETALAIANSPTASPEDRAAAKTQAAGLHQAMADSHEVMMRTQNAYNTAIRRTSGGSTGTGSQHLSAKDKTTGQPIHSEDGGKTWLPGP